MFTTVDKAIAALLSSVLFLLGAFGLDVSFLNEHMAWLMPAIVGIVTWLVPNKEPAGQ